MVWPRFSYILTESNKGLVLSIIRCLVGCEQNCIHPPNQPGRHQVRSYISQEQAAVLPWSHLLSHIQPPHKHLLIQDVDQHP